MVLAGIFDKDAGCEPSTLFKYGSNSAYSVSRDTLSYVQNMCKINNKITRTTSMTFSDVFIANFELISHIVIADFDKQMRAVVDQIKSRVSKHFTQNSTEKILPVNW